MAPVFNSRWTGFDLLNPSECAGECAPVFLLQLSFINGGVVLCVNAQHNVMDMVGQGHIMNLLSKARHGEQFSDEEVRRKYGEEAYDTASCG